MGHFAFRAFDGRLEFRSELQLVFELLIEPFAHLPHLVGREAAEGGLDFLHGAHDGNASRDGLRFNRDFWRCVSVRIFGVMALRDLVAAYLCKRTTDRTSLPARSGDGGAEFQLADAGGGIGIQIGITAQGFSHAVVRIVEHGGQGREELGSESGPLKLRQLSGLLLGFLDKRHAWKRWSEKSGINTEAIPVKRRARGNGARSRTIRRAGLGAG